MAQKITRRDSLPSTALTAGAFAGIDWRFGVFIQFDTDTYYGPGQISILSQNGAGGYTFSRYPDTDASAPGPGGGCGQPNGAIAPSDPLGLPTQPGV